MIRIVLRGVVGNARGWLGVLLGVALASALIGAALGTGEALRAALAARTALRAGPVQVVLNSEEGFFREELARELGGRAALRLPAVVSADDRSAPVQWVGLAQGPDAPPDGGVWIGRSLAERLGHPERIGVRFERPSRMPRDVALVQGEQRVQGFSAPVAEIGEDRWPLTMASDANPLALPAVLMPLSEAQRRVTATSPSGLRSPANLVLFDGPVPDLAARLASTVTAADVGLEVLPDGVVRSDRVVLPPAIARAILDGIPGAEPVLTWFAASLRGPKGEIPYLFVTAFGEVGRVGPPVAQLHPDAAARLGVAVGDDLNLRWPMLGRGRAVDWREMPLVYQGPAVKLDAALTPVIEGLSGKERCADWNPGLPVDLGRIGAEDEAWWAAHGATPQVRISYELGRRMFSSAWGDTTAVRLPVGTPASAVDTVLRGLDPGALGLTVTPLAEVLRASERPSNDLGVLFLGFEVTLLAATAALVVLLSAFTLQDRAREWWLLRAVGWSPGRIRFLVLAEAGIVAAIGATLGVPVAWAARAVLVAALEGAWSGAAVGLDFESTGAGGLAGGVVGAGALVMVAVALVWSRLGAPPGGARGGARRWAAAAVLALGGAVGIVASTEPTRSPEGAIAFFGAGAAALAAVLLATGAALRTSPGRSRDGLARSAASWRPGRALAVVGLLGSGAFVVVGVGLGAGMPAADPDLEESGGGGFARYGESLLPLVTGLEEPQDGVEVIAARRRDGDDASCLQLGSARTPHLLGINAARMGHRFGVVEGEGWRALKVPGAGEPIPVLGDASTVTWGLHLSVGDVLTMTDAAGEPFDVRIVGLTHPSLLQGALVMDEQAFLQHFPGDGGPRVFLVDGDEAAVAAASARWLRVHGDLGLTLVTASERLALFSEVERTWIAVFRVLGLLGLVLGALGVAVVVLRNLQERRSELATLAAVGWTPRAVAALLALEHLALLVAGLLGGGAAGVLAAWPAVRGGEAAPWGEVTLGLTAAMLVGAGGVVLAASRAPRSAAGRILLGEPRQPGA